MIVLRHFVSAGCILAGSAAVAADFDSAGVGTGTSEITRHEVGEKHMLMQLNTVYSGYAYEIADHPMEGMGGPCFGVVEFNAGAMSGGGKCLFSDADGDKMTNEWAATGLSEDGAMTGTWMIKAGTGKWANASGAGTFSSLTNPETGENANTITGSVTLP